MQGGNFRIIVLEVTGAGRTSSLSDVFFSQPLTRGLRAKDSYE